MPNQSGNSAVRRLAPASVLVAIAMLALVATISKAGAAGGKP
jgi:hypothetical protein